MDVEFEPVRLGPRRRRLDPVAAGAALVTIALALSVVKPWGDGPASNGEIAVPVTSPAAPMTTPEPAATPGTVIPRIISAASRSVPSWSEIKPVLGQHDSWGVRAILMGGGSFHERWFRFPAGGSAMSTAFLDAGDDVIVALGVTFPPSQAPLDVRLWRETGHGLDWVDTEALDPAPTGGGFLYGRPPIFGNVRRTWIPGTYRMDVLVDGSVRRLGIAIPDRFSNVPAGSERPNLRDMRSRTTLPSRSMMDVSGLFATTDGMAVPLPATPGPALDEVAAWLDVDPGTRRAPRSFVAETYLPRATSLGVMLESAAPITGASIARLAPEPLPAITPEIDDTEREGVNGSLVRFWAPEGGAWTPGVYRITVAWTDDAGKHEESWHVNLRPGPVRPAGQMLTATRAWARYAGDIGIVRGTAEPLEGGPRSATIRLERAVSGEGAGYPLRDRLPCEGFRVDGPAGLFGVAQPADASPAAVTARAHFEYSQSGAQRILTSVRGLPGLILVATDGAAAPISPAHRYRIGEDLDSTWSSLCVEVR